MLDEAFPHPRNPPPGPGTTPVEAGDPEGRGLPWLLFGFLFLTYLFFYAGHFSSTDEVHVYETTRSIVESGSLAIPPMLNTRRGRDGHYYSKYMVGQSIAAIPFYLLGKLAKALLPPSVAVSLAGIHLREEPVVWGGTVEIFFTGLYSPFVCALLMTAFFVLQRRMQVGLRAALAAALLVGLSTYVFGLSGHFLRHTSQALAVLIWMISLLDYRRSGSSRSLLAAGIATGSVVLFRIDGIFALPGLILAALVLIRAGEPVRRRSREFAVFLGPALLGLSIAVATHLWKWGVDPMNDGLNLLAGSPRVALLGFLLSPGSSVFVYSPLLLALLPGWHIWWRRDRWSAAGAIAIGLPFPLLYSLFIDWHGLWAAPGPRYLFLPMLLSAVPVGLWLEGRKTRLGVVLAALLVALGMAVQVVLATVNFPFTYISSRLPEGGLQTALFAPAENLLAHLVRNFLAGRYWDVWILNVARGGPDVPAQPLTGIFLAAIWALAWLALGATLVRGSRK